MVEESKYCSDVMRKHFNKDLVMNSTKYSVCDNDYIENDVKVRDQCHTTGKY